MQDHIAWKKFTYVLEELNACICFQPEDEGCIFRESAVKLE
jgi:hypothetical protein